MKNYVLRFLSVFVFALLFAVSVMAEKTVIYVWDQAKADGNEGVHPSQVLVDEIVATFGYTVTIKTNAQIDGYDEATLAEFQNADLIIIDRGLGSFNWSVERAALWDALETPILNMNPYSVRYNLLGWFESTTVDGYQGSDEVTESMKVLMPEDPAFEGVTLDDNNMMELWVGKHDILTYEAEFPGNGEYLIVKENSEGNPWVILARFEANVAFFEDGGVPAGPRTFFGLGNDSGGNAPFNYYTNFTEDGKKVFLYELERLATFAGSSIEKVNAELSASVSPNPVVNNLNVKMDFLNRVEVLDLTGKVVYSAKASGSELNVDLSAVSAGIYLVKMTNDYGQVAVEKVVKK